MSFALVPPEALAHITALANAAEGTQALDALCHTNRDTYQVCQIPFLQRVQLEPSLQSFLPNAPSRTAQGNLVSPLQVLEASRRLKQMTACVRYALYSAMVIAARLDPMIKIKGPLLTFDEFTKQDGLAPRDHLFAPIINRPIPRDHLILWLLDDGTIEIEFFSEPYSMRDIPWAPPDTNTHAFINRALEQAAIQTVIDTNSAEQTPALCASIDLFAVYPRLSSWVKVAPPGRYQIRKGVYSVGRVVIDLYPIFHPLDERQPMPPPLPIALPVIQRDARDPWQPTYILSDDQDTESAIWDLT